MLHSVVNLQTVQRLMVQAKDVTITVGDYKTTDTFHLEIDYKNFPFDPRSIRACGVVIYIQDMGRLYRDDGSFNKIVPGAPTAVDEDVTNAVFIGFADEEEIEFDDTHRKVKLTGRDSTALLIDQKYVENKPITLNLPIDKAIKELISSIPATAEIDILNWTIDPDTFDPEKLPTLAEYYPDFNDPMTGSKNPGQHETYWEIIQDICHRAGLICYFSREVNDKNQLVPVIILANPKNQVIPLNSQTQDDIKVIYGVNVKNLKLKRKLGRFKGFNLQVRCRVDKEVMIAKIPEQATVSWGTAYGFQVQSGTTVPEGNSTNFAPITVPVLKPDGSLDTAAAAKSAPYITFPVHDVANLDALIKIGQTLYEQYSLQQLEGSFDTFEMLGRGTSKGPDIPTSYKTYDLTQIRKGQTICVEINTDDLSSISRLSTVAERTQYLILRNYDKTIASIFATTMGKFSPRFQIKSYRMSMNDTSGWKLSVDFQNIIDTTFRSLK